MPIYKIRGINVDFPFEAYDCQIVYMEKVIESLQTKSNALLESPTGTGKTLCLLCATLAWRKSLGAFSHGVSAFKGKGNKDDGPSSQSETKKTGLPTIVYTSRTHSQLQQVIQELKRTNYRPKMTVLGSREQLCIHDDVQMLQGKAQTNACHFICKKRECKHQRQVPDYLKGNPYLGDEPVDIEDLVNIGRSHGACPYYVSRELHKVVDIVFAPYNYLIDSGNRGSLAIDFQNSVLIFDEAHNLEGICADAASFDLPSGLLTACISEAKKCIDLAVARRTIEKSNEKSLNPDNFAILKALLLKLEKRIAEVSIDPKELGFTRPGPYIYELLAELNITYETSNMLIDTIENASLLLEDAESGSNTNKQKSTTACRLESMSDILKTIFNNGEMAHSKSYRVHVQEVEAYGSESVKAKKTSRTLSWWCFNPGITMVEFSKLGVGSIILTSGTLSPLDSFAQELKLEFPIRLENPHVISANQIWAGVVSSGPSARSFNSSYRNRDSIEYKQELGNAIANFARIVPDGLLVFFPSYYLLDQCIGCWKDLGHAGSTNSATIWERICKNKQPVVEPRQSSLFSSAIEDYVTKLKDSSTSGAIFFAVCRGKVSEGLDFADHAGRAVIIIGMPFAMRNEPKVRLKREYMDQQALPQKNGQKGLTGEEWYSQQASRAVNQAVGRVIRHRHDYGAIILCDERFAYPNNQKQMSLWMQPHIKCYSKFGEAVFTLTRFFRDMKISNPMKPKSTQNIRKRSHATNSMLNERMQEPIEKDSLSVPQSSNLVHVSRLGNSGGVKVNESLDMFSTMKTQRRLATSTENNGSEGLLSSVLAVSRSNISNHMERVVAANQSILSPHVHSSPSTFNHLRGLHRGNKLQTSSSDSERNDLPYQKSEVVDLTSNSHWDEQLSTSKFIVACSSKKPKILKTDTDLSFNTNSSAKHGNQSQVSQCKSEDLDDNSIRIKGMQHAQVDTVVVLEDDIRTEKTDLKHKHVSTCPVPSGEETRGANFLIKVQEKLTPKEYKEFVGYMKALKSKTMKINDVLQSIVRLFSTPERFLLLTRFKDFVPAKYRPMYEQYLKNS